MVSHSGAGCQQQASGAHRDRGVRRRRPWTTSAAQPAPTDHQLHDGDRRIRAQLADVRSSIDQPGVMLVDVRSTADAVASGSGHPRAPVAPSAAERPLRGSS